MKFYLLFLITLYGCSTVNTVKLNWHNTIEKPQRYRAIVSNKMSEQNIIPVNTYELIKNPTLDNNTIERLKNLPVHKKIFPLDTTVNYIGDDKLEIKMVSRHIDYTDATQSKDEQNARNIQKKMEGVTMLQANISKSGDIESFYFEQTQLNALSMLFELPKGNIKVGDSWPINVNLIRLNNGFHGGNSMRLSKVLLKSLYNHPDVGLIAELVYVLAEFVNGKMGVTQEVIDSAQEFEMSTSYIAYGEFVVDKGYWKLYNGQLSAGGGKGEQQMVVTRFSLIPLESY